MAMKTIFEGKPERGSLEHLEAARGGKNTPYCNTGGYENLGNISNLHNPSFDNQNSSSNNNVNVTAIDWLRMTVTDLDGFNGAMGDIADEGGILDSADMKIHWTEKGMHGYSESASIMIWKDSDYLTVGHIAKADQGQNKGGLFELTGMGCKVLQIEYPDLWAELYNVLQYHDWRISRVDVALDLSGEYAKAHGYTVPKLFEQCVMHGLLQSDNLRNPNMKQAFNMAGDWSAFAVGSLTPAIYDPLKDCPAGLTAYIGKRASSDDFFRIYEKGKELLGKMAEPESIDRGWVRIEHEMSRKASGRNIPLDVMLRPDVYFCAGRSGVRAILNQLREHRAMLEAQSWQREQFKREKGLLLSRKIHWAKHTYGRLIRTLLDKGIDAQDIIDLLSREAGLKEFVFDILDGATVQADLLAVAA